MTTVPCHAPRAGPSAPPRMDTKARSIYRAAIGARLAVARESRGLSQQDLADAIGCSKSVVSNWERGVNCPPADNLGQIATLLRCSVDWIIGTINGEDRVCLIDTQVETILLASGRVDREFRVRQARLATIAHVSTERCATLEELGERVAAVERHRRELEGDDDGKPPPGRGVRPRLR